MASLLEYLMTKGAAPAPEGEMPSGLPVAGGRGSPLLDAFIALQAGRVKDAVAAPRDAYTGDLQVYDPTTGHVSVEAMDRANGMAGLAATGSLPLPVPKGAVRMFGGWNAANADHATLAKAQNLKSAGASKQAIWEETGWFQGPDQNWRFEIPDDLATIGSAGNAPPGYSRLHHDDLAAAYPEMWDRTQQSIREAPTASGRYQAEDDAIFAQAPTLAEQRSIALHELQHAIQAEEGLARGANPRSFTVVDWEAAGLPMLSEGRNAAQAQERWARDQYHRSAGEVEARNVQARRDMTPEQRRALPPWETQDVPDAMQIVNLGMRLSR